MAFFKDTGYARPSIEEVQKKAPIAAAVNNDVINAGRSFADNATRVTGGQMLQKGVNAVSDVRDRNKIVIQDPTAPRFRPKEDYAANNDPIATRATMQRPVGQVGVAQATTVPAQIAQTQTGVIMPPQESQPQSNRFKTAAMTQADGGNGTISLEVGTGRMSRPQGSVSRASNYDVQFDPSVSQGRRDAFMRDPVRTPPTQMPASSGGDRGFIRPDYGWGKDAKQGNELAYTKESHPELGWKSRLELNQQDLRNKSQEGVNAVNVDGNIRSTEASRFASRLGYESAFGANANVADKNQIDAFEAQGNVANTMSQARTRALANEQSQNLITLQQQLGQEVDPVKRKEILAQMQAINGRSAKTEAPYTNIQAQDVIGEDGMPVKEYIGFNTQTNQIERIPMGA